MEAPVLVRSDWDARIHIEGVGLAERRLEVTPAIAGWTSLSVRSYTFRAGQVIDGESAEDEMAMVLLSGSVAIDISGPGGEQRWECRGRESVFSGMPHAIYLPPGYRYKTTVHADADCLYGRAPASGARSPRLIRPEDVQVEGARAVILSTDVTEHLRCTQTIVHPGEWAGAEPTVAGAAERVAYYRADPATGWGMQRLAGPGDARAVLVRQADAVIVRTAPSEVVAGPETTLCVLEYAAVP